MNTSGLLQSLQETRSIHESMNIPEIQFISEIQHDKGYPFKPNVLLLEISKQYRIRSDTIEKTANKYDHEIPQSHTADQPTAPW